MRKLGILWALVVLAAGPLAAQQDNWVPQIERGSNDYPRGTMVIQNLDAVWTAAGEVLQNVSIVVRDGVIREIGAEVSIPDGAVVIDLRSRREYDAWHHPEALHFDFPKALEAWPHFGKDRAYVLYCEYGLKSAHLAEMMQAAGFRAWHFTGGTAALRRRTEGRA